MDDLTYGAGIAAIVFILLIVVILSVNGMDLSVKDYRLFTDIAQECEEKGFIQDQQIRIMCEVENP